MFLLKYLAIIVIYFVLLVFCFTFNVIIKMVEFMFDLIKQIKDEIYEQIILFRKGRILKT